MPLSVPVASAKRQRTAALQDASRLSQRPNIRRSWSAAVLCRFFAELTAALIVFAIAPSMLTGATKLPDPKSVPRMQAIPLPNHEISFQRDGEDIARYHFGPDLRRPFVFPIIGPSGRSLTRMGHPHDPESHSHHNSVWISHDDVNGISFWDDRAKGRIIHQRIESLEDRDEAASVRTVNLWSASNQVLLIEHRLTRVEPLEKNEWLLTIDLELQPKQQEITFGKTPFGLIGVRMAKTIGVNDGGGRIRNSEGGVNEREVLWKRARWVDYSGPITAHATAACFVCRDEFGNY